MAAARIWVRVHRGLSSPSPWPTPQLKMTTIFPSTGSRVKGNRGEACLVTDKSGLRWTKA
uniref:Uncharacterized protein n=1 Tax=Oryza glumipatula TaxID=40148 RepID=A0A0D9YYE9_9ORYZ